VRNRNTIFCVFKCEKVIYYGVVVEERGGEKPKKLREEAWNSGRIIGTID
jgi:hypothetical protein